MRTFEVKVTRTATYLIEADSSDEAQDIAIDMSGWKESAIETVSFELDESQIESAKERCLEFFPKDF